MLFWSAESSDVQPPQFISTTGTPGHAAGEDGEGSPGLTMAGEDVSWKEGVS